MYYVPSVGDTLLNRYYIEEILSQNDHACVAKCMDTRLDVYCALKILLGDTDAPDWAERKAAFMRAYRTQAQLNHPNIVHVSNIESREGVTFGVMELLQGPTLEQYLRGDSLGAKEIVELFLSIADAVSMAHSSLVIHRSLSPVNIILHQQGARLSPRILNFSVERDLEQLDPVWDLPYMSPEQLIDFNDSWEASDVFALCMMMHSAFAHCVPVECKSLQEYIDYYMSSDGAEPLAELMPADFVPLIRRGIRANPAERFENATELLKALKTLSSGFKLSANLTIEAPKQYPSVTPSSPVIPRRTSSLDNPIVSGGFPTTTPSSPIIAPRRPSSLGVDVSSIVKDASGELSRPMASRPSLGSVPAAPMPSRPSVQSVPVSGNTGASVMGVQYGQVNAGQYAQSGVALPPELAELYRLCRVDSVLPTGVVGSVMDINGGTEAFGVKFFEPKSDVERAVFNEGVRRLEALSRENETFESVLFHFPDSCAFLMTDTSRQSLTDSIKRNGVLQPAVAAQAALLIAQGMEFAHQHGVVNGNLKPSNLIFEEHSGIVRPVIYDLGQRLYINSVEQITFADIPYIAPELNFNLQNTNAQADIFAFGMCMVFMLLGKSMYASATKEALVAEIQACSETPQLLAIRPDIDPALAQVIQWCINFDPSGRYVRFSDVIRDLYVVYQNMLKAL